MGLSINKISDVTLQRIATQNDANHNGKLEKNEYNLFQQQAQEMLEQNEVTAENYLQAVKQYHSGVIGWFRDDNMVCKDTKNDGKIGFCQAALNVGEGLVGGIAKAVVQHPIKSAIAIAAGVGATVLTGGAILPAFIGLGLVAGTGVTVAGVVQASKATTDGDKKKAFENVGTGVSTILLSALGIKSANKVAADAGVKGLQGLEDASLLQNVKAGVKSTPEMFKVSGLNAKGNALTWMSAIKGDKIIYANSNETRTGVMVGKQSGNPVEDAYKVDLKGSVEEVLAKNPELSYDAEAGKFYVQTSWGSKSYIQSDNYMVLKYGPGDNNAVEGLEFYDTYIDQAAREATGKNIYINPDKLQPGQHVYTAKEAPARFKVVSEGTKYVGAETKAGEVDVVQPGSVLRIDGQGRPYQSRVDWMLKKVTLTDEQVGALGKVDPNALTSTPRGIEYISGMQSSLKKALNSSTVQYDKTVVTDLIDKNPETVLKLLNAKAPNGQPLFTPSEINDFLYNSQHGFIYEGVIPQWQQRVTAILNNPEEVAIISDSSNKGAGLWRAIQDPISSTTKANPDLF